MSNLDKLTNLLIKENVGTMFSRPMSEAFAKRILEVLNAQEKPEIWVWEKDTDHVSK